MDSQTGRRTEGWMDRHTDVHTVRKKDLEKDRKTDRRMERWTDGQTD